jgi:hypothetical protein
MFKVLFFSYLFTMSYAIPLKCHHSSLTTSTLVSTPTPETVLTPQPETPVSSSGDDSSRYWNEGCDTGGVYSVNEFGANICEYPGDTCPIVKYFVYPEGGNGVELCCNTNADCNYAAVKNYCHPDYKRCTDGSYFGCSVKEGPIFESCL